MNNEYKYDLVNNVLSVSNVAPVPPSGAEGASMGGQMKHTYQYDNLYRLTDATGVYTGANKKTAQYSLAMSYDKLHNITSKEQNIQQMGVTFDGKLSAGYKLDYTYGKKPHQIDNIKDENYRTEGKDVKTPKKTENVYEYDENGNLIFVSKNKSKDEKQNERKLLWDEENRLEAVSDNGYVSLYTYDAGGERVAKLSGNGESVYVNSKNAGKRTQTNRYTAYISPYFVLSSGGEYTKHIMIGSQRIVSKLGDVKSFGEDPRRIEYAGTTESIKIDYPTKYKKSQQIFRDRYKRLDVVYNGKDNDDYRGGDSFCCGKKKDGFGKKGARPSKSARGGITNNDKPELFQYYYHPDHLGSSSYITNLDGEVAQHIEYVPFGEVFLNEQNNKWNTPYLFNGKELDEETGLVYYGARYYNPRTSQWASVDPLALYDPVMEVEHYLDGQHNGGYFNPRNTSVYGYCYQSPIVYIDPNGKQAHFVRAMRDNSNQGVPSNITRVLGGAASEITGTKALMNDMNFSKSEGSGFFQQGMYSLWREKIRDGGLETSASSWGGKAKQVAKVNRAIGWEKRLRAFKNYSSKWARGNSSDAIKKFASEAKGVLSPDGVKTRYLNKKTNIEVIVDNENRYFRIRDHNKNQYVNMEGKTPSTGSLKGKEAKDLVKSQTHFIDEK